MLKKDSRNLVGALLLASLVVCPVMAQKEPLRVGSITDGPWDRDQLVLATFESKIAEALAATHEVQFADEKQLNGDWTSKGAKTALNHLLADPEVDIIITLGLVSSYEAAKRRALAKPVIATRVIAPEVLKIQAKQVGTERVSGIPNLSYITVEGLDLAQKMGVFSQIVPFSHLTFLVMESLRELFPRLEGLIATELAPLNLSGISVIFVGDSLGPALAALPPGVQAVVLTPLPQLEPADYSKLLNTLLDMRLPTFTLGARQDVAMGVMAGLTAPREVEVLAERTASNIKKIVGGQNPGDIPVNLPVEESLMVNTLVASALGITINQSPLADAQQTSGAQAGQASPSMATVTEEEPALRVRPGRSEELQRQEEQLTKQVQQQIFRLSSYTAFDAISFSVNGNKVILLGYAYRPVLKEDVERAINRIEGVEVESHIEVLPTSSFDDEIRARAYWAIYSNPQLRRYAPGGGFLGYDRQRALSDLRFGLDAIQQVRGPHPIHIVVKDGNVALVGVVNSRIDRQIAEMQVQTLSGIFSVENHLQATSGD